MPATVILPHPPLPCPQTSPANGAIEFVQRACGKEAGGADIVALDGTWQRVSKAHGVVPSSDGFIRGVYKAWAQHLHLVLRPDEVWFAVLIQMNAYMAGHGEELRHLFVAHEGQEEIHAPRDDGIECMLVVFKEQIQQKVKTPWLRDWIMPAFSTTTPDDELTASVVMMGLMSQYFTYSSSEICGIPSVTLLGERQDWVELVGKLERLVEFWQEPEEYAEKLRPILQCFVETFDDPRGSRTAAFWDRVARSDPDSTCGRPPVKLDGWILDFLHWDREGRRLHHPDIYRLPINYVAVDLLDANSGQTWKLVAGTLAESIRPGAPADYYGALGCPVPGPDAKLPAYRSQKDPGTSRTQKNSRGGRRRAQQEVGSDDGEDSNGGSCGVLKALWCFGTRPGRTHDPARSFEVVKTRRGERPIVKEPTYVDSKTGEQDLPTGNPEPGPNFFPELDELVGATVPIKPTQQEKDDTVKQKAERTDALPPVRQQVKEDQTLEEESFLRRRQLHIQIVTGEGAWASKHGTLQPMSGWMLVRPRDWEMKEIQAVSYDEYVPEYDLCLLEDLLLAKH